MYKYLYEAVGSAAVNSLDVNYRTKFENLEIVAWIVDLKTPTVTPQRLKQTDSHEAPSYDSFAVGTEQKLSLQS